MEIKDNVMVSSSCGRKIDALGRGRARQERTKALNHAALSSHSIELVYISAVNWSSSLNVQDDSAVYRLNDIGYLLSEFEIPDARCVCQLFLP